MQAGENRLGLPSELFILSAGYLEQLAVQGYVLAFCKTMPPY